MHDSTKTQICRLLMVLGFAMLIAFLAAGAMFYWYGQNLYIEFKVKND